MASPNFLTASMLLRVVLVENGISFCTLEAQKRLWVRVLLLIEVLGPKVDFPSATQEKHPRL